MAIPQLSDEQAHLAHIGLKPGERAVFIKQFAGDVEVAEDRRVRFTITTSTPDRERDVVATAGIETGAFELNPVVQWAHDYKTPPIGRCLSLERTGDKIVATVEFASAELNPFADQIYRMVKAGFIKATSIGFRPLEWVYNEARKGVDFLKIELMEFSLCPIPANAEALVALRASGVELAVLKAWAEQTLAALDVKPAPPPRTTGDQIQRNAIAVAPVEYVRWNCALSKAFDVAAQEFPARSIEQDLAAKYCGCAVKDLYHRQGPVYSTRLGAFLAALDEVLAATKQDDLRNIGADGREAPPLYERIQLNSTRAEEFLVDGLRFLQLGSVKLALRVEPCWYGLQVTVYVERKHADAGRAILDRTLARAREMNFLVGEAFSLSGEFLTRSAESLDDVFLSEKNQAISKRLLSLIEAHGATIENRGVIMLGPPGNGKTLLGRILMNQTKTTFVWCSARDFYYSGGFRGLSEAFEIGRESAAAGTPAILFIEDVDNYLSGETTDLMKTEMDGIAQSRGVITILTTNYPELLPKALIDRPGRFHDILRFDLPDVAAQTQMLARWLPDLAGQPLANAVKALHGYSGAHVREFARFAAIIRDQDGVAVDVAATTALEKLQEQRDLITAVQAQGSRYRALEAIRAKLAAAPDLAAAHYALAAFGPFLRDGVGWKAFVKARDRAIRKAGETLSDAALADLLADYGFEPEAAALRKSTCPVCNGVGLLPESYMGDPNGQKPCPSCPAGDAERQRQEAAKAPDVMEPDTDGKCPDGMDMGEDGMCHMRKSELMAQFKSGRVLSKSNETRVRNARDAAAVIAEQLDAVIQSVARDLDADDDAPVALARMDDDVVLRIALDEEPAFAVDDGMVADAIRAAMSEIVQREMRVALNEARGRID